jgi:pimeloyl-ACP methyl ester carboxylesterase
MKTLILLPGSLSDEYIWWHQLKALTPEYTVICPDLHDNDSLEEMAEEALKQTSGTFSLIGTALGARIALEMYRIAPERIERLALISASIGPVGKDEAEQRLKIVDQAYEVGLEEMAARFMPRMIHPSLHDDADLLSGMVNMTSRFTPEGYAREARTLLKRPDQEPILSTITCPTLVMTGSDDDLSPVERAHEIADAIPNAKVAVIENAAHFPMIERPDEVTRVLREWLAS